VPLEVLKLHVPTQLLEELNVLKALLLAVSIIALTLCLIQETKLLFEDL
jgi:hypothetical protein